MRFGTSRSVDDRLMSEHGGHDAEGAECPLMALSGHPSCAQQRPLSGGKADITIVGRNVR